MANLRADNLTGTGGRNAIDGSVLFNGGADNLSIPSIALGSGDWTIEFWFYSIKEGSQDGHIYDGRGTGSAGSAYPIIKFDTDEKLSFYTTGAIRIQGSSVVKLGSWNHVALVKNSSTTTLYLNGQSEGTYSDSNTYLAPSNSIGRIGSDDNGSAYFFYGYLSNYRFVTGTAVYTAAFTPPTEKLTAIDGTVLLCCQDSDDPTQEAIGKTITGYGNLDITQTEKINGRWNQDPTGNGWTLHSGASGSYSNGAWQVTSPASAWHGASTSFTSVIGQIYHITAIVTTSNNWGSISVSGVSGTSASKIAYYGWSSGGPFPLTVDSVFTATATTTYISIDNLNTTNTTATTVQYISVKPVGYLPPKALPSVGVDEGVTFEGDTKVDSQGYMYFPTGDTSQRGRGRGFRFGGDSPAKANNIEFVNIQSQGTAQDFGDLLTTLTQGHAGSSSIRSIIFAGYNAPSTVSDIQYITNATQGNSIDAGINVGGDFTRYCNVVSNEVRSVYGGGTPGYTATIEYVTNASLSSVTDFGDFSAGGMYSAATMNSSTRGIFAGGYYNPGGGATKLNTIQYITIMTTGNSQDFGDLVTAVGGPHGICSSPTRGIAWDGSTNTIQYLTIATTGNGADFGDATVAGFNSGVSFSSHTRGVAGGGYNNPGSGSANQNWIEYVTISTTGNASDFGDLRTVGSSMGGSSDCHGGLS